jgi:hypothetical protein
MSEVYQVEMFWAYGRTIATSGIRELRIGFLWTCIGFLSHNAILGKVALGVEEVLKGLKSTNQHYAFLPSDSSCEPLESTLQSSLGIRLSWPLD